MCTISSVSLSLTHTQSTRGSAKDGGERISDAIRHVRVHHQLHTPPLRLTVGGGERVRARERAWLREGGRENGRKVGKRVGRCERVGE